MKNILVPVLILLVVGFGVYYFIHNKPITNTPTPLGSTVVDISTWTTFTDTAHGVSFKYPKTLSTTYISTQDWPPHIEVTNEKVTCLSAGEETERAGSTQSKTINGHTYCVTKVSEGAAGSTYDQYAYGAQMGDRYAFFTFTLRLPQCGNYDDPKKTECEKERSAFNIDQIMDAVIQSAKVAPINIIYKNATADNIVVDNPFPDAVVGKTFTATGKARGNWYFEASFPIEVLDKNGKTLFQTHANAQGEWMTTDFVPFKSETITIPASYIGPATIVFHNDNASGLPENEKSVSFPINIEY